MELFQPDNHARDAVRFLPPSPRDFELAKLAVKSHFGMGAAVPQPFEVLEGANLNSANYRMGNFYLKVVRDTPERDFLDTFPALIQRLKAHGVPVVDVHCGEGQAAVGAMRFEDVDYRVIVQPFLDAHYCHGDRWSLESFLKVWPSLEAATETLDPTPGQRSPYEGYAMGIRDILETHGALGDDDVVWQNRDLILRTVVSVAQRTASDPPQWGLYHYDLHPHNLMYRGSDLAAVIDLESFRWVPKQVALGYAVFKLARKGVSLGRMSIEEVRSATAALPPEVHAWGVYEVLRRIEYLLRQRYEKQDLTWDHDLGKFVASLAESAAMFG